MSINIEVNNENIQYLSIVNEINKDDKNNFLNYILNLGFQEYIKLKNLNFNNTFLSNNSLDNNNNLLNNLDIIIENKTNKLFNLINEIKQDTIIEKSNNIKGITGENIIFDFFKVNFSNYTLEDTSQIPHSGDLKLFIPEITENVLIEVKNYKNTIDQKQIDKLYYDLNYTGINYAIFISLKSNIVNKKNNIEWELKDNKVVIFISNFTNELLFLSIYILTNLNSLIKNNKQINNKHINEDKLLYMINNIIIQKNTINQLKNNILSLHDNVSKEILNIYNLVIKYENELFYNINNLKGIINKNIDNYNKPINNNDIIHQIHEIIINKNLLNTIELIISHFLDTHYIEIIDNKKIIIKKNENIIYTIKILKSSLNLITHDNIEIKNIDINNWNKIIKIF
jgi:hypothetical protein